MHYSLGFLKVTLGLLRLSAVRMGGVINLSAENLSTPWTPTSGVLCMRAGLREWVHPVPSRQGIYLLNSQSLSVVGGHRYNVLGLASPHPTTTPFSCSLSHLSAWVVSMRNKQPRLWPFDRKTVGNKTSENRKDEGERGTSQSGALEGSTWSCLIENRAALSLMTIHGWTADWEASPRRGRCHEEEILSHELCRIKITEQFQRCRIKMAEICVQSCACVLTFFVIHKSSHTSFCIVSHCVVIDWGRQLVIHEHHRRSIRFSLSAFNGRLFYSLIKWDSTPPPHTHLSVSLHDNQLMHVQTPSGSATYNNPDKGYRGYSAKGWSVAICFPPPANRNAKG